MAAVPCEFFVSRCEPEIEANTERMSQPAISSASSTARWIECKDAKKLAELRERAYEQLALDHGGALVYLAPSRVNLQLTLERWPQVTFRETREVGA